VGIPESVSQHADVSRRRCAVAWHKCRRLDRGSPRRRADSLIARLELVTALTTSRTADKVVPTVSIREYANAVQISWRWTSCGSGAAADDVAEGFDNIAAALQVSPPFIEQHVIAAAPWP
jgi:hypothetical protein